MEELNDLELTVLAHRYMYYVECDPIITDYEYDMLEREARKLLPESSPVHGVGSSLPGTYSTEVCRRVNQLRHT
mgnify:CR=1 FL=1|jgi:NAD-dependent DNA ligase